jgi:hypothetical protein
MHKLTFQVVLLDWTSGLQPGPSKIKLNLYLKTSQLFNCCLLHSTYHACSRIFVLRLPTFDVASFIEIRKQDKEQNAMETNPDHETFWIMTVWIKEYLELMRKYQHKLHLQTYTDLHTQSYQDMVVYIMH